MATTAPAAPWQTTGTAEPIKNRTIKGAILYNVWSEWLPTSDGQTFREQIAPGAFADSIGQDTVPFKTEHMGPPFATTADRLTLNDTPTALEWSLDCPADDMRSQQLYADADDGCFDGVSFGFVCQSDRWDATGNYRTVLRAKLTDISLVLMPAYPDFQFELRRKLARLFHASDVDQFAAAANDTERRLTECRRLPSGMRESAAQRTRQEFLQFVASRRRLDQFELIELRKRFNTSDRNHQEGIDMPSAVTAASIAAEQQPQAAAPAKKGTVYVRLLKNCASPKLTAPAGHCHEVETDHARELIRAGAAIEITEAQFLAAMKTGQSIAH